MWARNFVVRWCGKRLQGVKKYLWGARRMRNEARPSANPSRISAWLLTHCICTFAFEPKRVSFGCDESKHLFQFLQLSAKLVAAEFEPEISTEVHFEGEHTWQFFAADGSQTILKGFWDVTCRNQMPTRIDDEILAHVVECIQKFLLVSWAPAMGWKRSVKHLVFGAHKINLGFKTEMQPFLQKKVVSYLTSILKDDGI